MKKCPLCKVDLQLIEYEIFKILQCPECHGHLASLDRMELIKRTRGRTKPQLAEEAKSEFSGSTEGKINCPRCFFPMRKQKVRCPAEIYIDVCEECRLAWLDAGELAIVQLAYEVGRQGLEAEEFMRRAADLELNAERRAAFEKAMEDMPKDMGIRFEDIGGTEDLMEALILDAFFSVLGPTKHL